MAKPLLNTSGFPTSQVVKFKYRDVVNITNSGLFTAAFRLNSLYDPDYTYTGHQPYTFDTYSTVYTRYRVYDCKFKVKILNRSTQAAVVAIYPNNVTGVTAYANEALEQPFSKYGVLGINSSNRCELILQLNVNIAGALGYDKNVDDDLSALISNSPSQQLYMHLWLDSLPSDESVSFTYIVEMDFTALMYDLKDAGLSLNQKKSWAELAEEVDEPPEQIPKKQEQVAQKQQVSEKKQVVKK